MLQAFIITLREGVEAALIVGITLAYLAKIGRNDLRKTVYAALGAAFLGSIGVAVVISRLNWNEDVFEGWVMLVAAFFVVTMIIFMMKTGRKLKGQIEGKVGLLAGNDAWVGLFFFVFLMVLREGAETVLILSAVSLNSTELMSFLGTLLGVLAAVAFGVMFVKGSVRINLQKFFRVTTAILFLVALQLVVAGLHELSESGVIPSSKREMAIIGPIVRNDLFFFVTIFALAALMVLFDAKRRQPVPEPASPAERRKAAWTARKERFWMASVYVFSFLFITLVTAEFIYAKSVSALSPATEVTFHQRSGKDSASAGFRWRPAPLSGAGEWHGDPILALSEAGRQDRHSFRCLRNLRRGRFLQVGQYGGLQELCRADQSAVGGHDRRMQSSSAQGNANC